MDIFTVGYQGRGLDGLTQLLKQHAIDIVLDVRERAWSRKPGFSKPQLDEALARLGIEYLHEPRLGSPANIREAYRQSGDWAQFSAAYSEHLAGLGEVLAGYAAELVGRRVCLLCFEEQASLCHRLAVANAFGPLLVREPRHL